MRPLIEVCIALTLAAPAPLYACAVCFGKSDNTDLPGALIWGGVVLLGATFLLLTGLGIAIYRIEVRRAARHS